LGEPSAFSPLSWVCEWLAKGGPVLERGGLALVLAGSQGLTWGGVSMHCLLSPLGVGMCLGVKMSVSSVGYVIRVPSGPPGMDEEL